MEYIILNNEEKLTHGNKKLALWLQLCDIFHAENEKITSNFRDNKLKCSDNTANKVYWSTITTVNW
jgi:hypothetical protein